MCFNKKDNFNLRKVSILQKQAGFIGFLTAFPSENILHTHAENPSNAEGAFKAGRIMPLFNGNNRLPGHGDFAPQFRLAHFAMLFAQLLQAIGNRWFGHYSNAPIKIVKRAENFKQLGYANHGKNTVGDLHGRHWRQNKPDEQKQSGVNC